MLTVEENETLTRVGPGTPMGKVMGVLLVPRGLYADLPVGHTRRIRLLGENFVMYRDQSGQLGMVDESARIETCRCFMASLKTAACVAPFTVGSSIKKAIALNNPRSHRHHSSKTA
jgi:hypothetical protein